MGGVVTRLPVALVVATNPRLPLHPLHTLQARHRDAEGAGESERASANRAKSAKARLNERLAKKKAGAGAGQANAYANADAGTCASDASTASTPSAAAHAGNGNVGTVNDGENGHGETSKTLDPGTELMLSFPHKQEEEARCQLDPDTESIISAASSTLDSVNNSPATVSALDEYQL